jgi:5-methylcytosine-specific restriction protein A
MPSRPPLHGTASREYDKQRGSSAERGYDARWRAYRITFLQANPLCVECLKKSRTTAATVVDHIEPHRGDTVLFWDTENHQAMCAGCHGAKTRAGL